MKEKNDGRYESKKTMVAMKLRNDGRYEIKKRWSL